MDHIPQRALLRYQRLDLHLGFEYLLLRLHQVSGGVALGRAGFPGGESLQVRGRPVIQLLLQVADLRLYCPELLRIRFFRRP